MIGITSSSPLYHSSLVLFIPFHGSASAHLTSNLGSSPFHLTSNQCTSRLHNAPLHVNAHLGSRPTHHTPFHGFSPFHLRSNQCTSRLQTASSQHISRQVMSVLGSIPLHFSSFLGFSPPLHASFLVYCTSLIWKVYRPQPWERSWPRPWMLPYSKIDLRILSVMMPSARTFNRNLRVGFSR